MFKKNLSRNNLLREYVKEALRNQINVSESEPETFGDLKKILNAVVLSQGNKAKAKKIIKKSGLETGFDVALDYFVPYGGAAKSVLGLIKKIASMKDESRPDNFLGDLDIDDQISLIIDNSLEEKFIEYVTRKINEKPDDEKLKGFTMTGELNNFLKRNFRGRHFKVR